MACTIQKSCKKFLFHPLNSAQKISVYRGRRRSFLIRAFLIGHYSEAREIFESRFNNVVVYALLPVRNSIPILRSLVRHFCTPRNDQNSPFSRRQLNQPASTIVGIQFQSFYNCLPISQLHQLYQPILGQYQSISGILLKPC